MPARTPDERFANLPGYPFEPHYLDVASHVGPLRVHYVDEGPRDGEPVLFLHGEPSWSYLYRKMIPVMVEAGYRVLAPDLVGFGRSDKLEARSEYTYERHVAWVTDWLEQLDLKDITLFCQDWGSLIGLRVAAENEERFARIAVGNGGLPTGDQQLPKAFFAWQKFSQETPEFPVGVFINGASVSDLSAEEIAAYDAPFPDESFKEAARAMPMLVPSSPDDPAAPANRTAWEVLQNWTKPFLTTFSDSDPITAGGDELLRKLIPGCEGQPHVTIEKAGHFLQEDKGEEIARHLVKWMQG